MIGGSSRLKNNVCLNDCSVVTDADIRPSFKMQPREIH
jgi:hypothetical protein